MQELSPSSSPQQPFAPGEPSASPGGCARPVWIGCAVVILLGGIAALIGLMKVPEMFEWAMGKFESEVMESLPADVSQGQRERLAEAFAEARNAVADGTADPQALQRLQQQLGSRILGSDGKLTAGDVEELTVALEAVAGVTPEPSEEEALPDSGENAPLMMEEAAGSSGT